MDIDIRPHRVVQLFPEKPSRLSIEEQIARALQPDPELCNPEFEVWDHYLLELYRCRNSDPFP